MFWTLKSLMLSAQTCQTEINGMWVPTRPAVHPFRLRIKYAWAVLTGKADAVVWPEGQ